MELHQLDCFLAVLQEGSFKGAAARLHRTQPAISYQIRQLEGELGLSLFHRRAKKTTPTEAGRVLEQHAKELLECAAEARQAVERLTDGVAGEIRLGTINSVGIHFLPRVLWAIREKFPAVQLNVTYRETQVIIDELLSNRFNVALVANPAPDRRLRQEVIVRERVSLVCGPSHPLYGRSAIRPSELEGQQFVALTPDHPTGELVRDFLVRLGINVEPVVSTANVQTVKKMVEVGLGVAFLPDMVTASDVDCDSGRPGRLARIAVGPPLQRSIVLVTPAHVEPSSAVAAFAAELRVHGSRWRGCVDEREP